MTGPDRQGFNRIAWDLRELAGAGADEGQDEGNQEEERDEELVDVEPGTYTVRLMAGGTEMTRTVTVVPDRRK